MAERRIDTSNSRFAGTGMPAKAAAGGSKKRARSSVKKDATSVPAAAKGTSGKALKIDPAEQLEAPPFSATCEGWCEQDFDQSPTQ